MHKFTQFEVFLQRESPWVAGLDFAFGQPLKLIENLDFPRDWEEYVGLVDSMGKKAWVSLIDGYMQPRPSGDKLHFRVTDRIAGAQSPMTMYFIPVGRMFYEGTRRLLASEVSILPNRPTLDNRLVFEVYPALLARKFVGHNSSYKNDNKLKQTLESLNTRQQIIDGLRENCFDQYGFSLDLSDSLAHEFVLDPTGDKLDAMLCTVQAAWAYTRRDYNYGIPPDIDPLEGWIVDPQLLEKYYG